MQNIKKYFMTLALLLTAVTGAWAETTVTFTASDLADGSSITKDGVTLTANGQYGINSNGVNGPGEFTNSFGGNFTKIVVTADGLPSGDGWSAGTWTGSASSVSFTGNIDTWGNEFSIVCTLETASTGPEVAWDNAKKTGQFTMPGGNVELEPEYYPAAQWAKVENVDQLPTAIEGIYAGTTDAIVNAGAVATGQGTVMYAVTSTNQATAPELSAFSATLPTAENIADDGATVYVWYYIQGTDTPDGQEATAENTFNDSEICTTPLQVTVLSNKFDITLKAANANTIEADKATVTVGGTAATVTEGKLQGVKMGSEVKLEAKPGYKFRKVEVKKGGAAAAKTITIGDMELTYADGDTWETIVSKNSDKIKILAGIYIVQVAQPAPYQYRYIHVWYTEVKPTDIIDPSKNYQWDTMETAH